MNLMSSFELADFLPSAETKEVRASFTKTFHNISTNAWQ